MTLVFIVLSALFFALAFVDYRRGQSVNRNIFYGVVSFLAAIVTLFDITLPGLWS